MPDDDGFPVLLLSARAGVRLEERRGKIWVDELVRRGVRRDLPDFFDFRGSGGTVGCPGRVSWKSRSLT